MQNFIIPRQNDRMYDVTMKYLASGLSLLIVDKVVTVDPDLFAKGFSKYKGHVSSEKALSFRSF